MTGEANEHKTEAEAASENLMAEVSQSGSEAAFAALYQRHARDALNFAFRMLHDASTAKDAVQDAYSSIAPPPK